MLLNVENNFSYYFFISESPFPCFDCWILNIITFWHFENEKVVKIQENLNILNKKWSIYSKFGQTTYYFFRSEGSQELALSLRHSVTPSLRHSVTPSVRDVFKTENHCLACLILKSNHNCTAWWNSQGWI